MSDMTVSPPPRDGLARAVFPGTELRAGEKGEMPTMRGHFAVFNEWTTINSRFEGHFLERFAPGAFKKTLEENRAKLRVLFQHGKDPQIGDKPLGPITELREDDHGAYYEAQLLDTSYNRDLLPGLEAGLYGASFRFGVVQEEFNRDSDKSASNPEGLPERTVTEARVLEFGPVTFPAYAGATAGVRSITDALHDAETMAAAAVVMFDEERLSLACLFVTRAIPEPTGEDQPEDRVYDDDTEEALTTGEAGTRSHLTDMSRASGRSHLIPPKREGRSHLL